MFKEFKKAAVKKLDIAKKEGKADKKIIKLLDLINSSENYYTTSSCYGRIVLLKDKLDKQPGSFIIRWHRKIKVKDLKDKLEKKYFWFKMEGVILHVGCSSLESANSFLRYARSIGFKKSGIIESSKRIIVEISSTEKVDMPVNSELSSKYLRKAVDESNRRFEQNSNRLKRLYRFFRNK